MKAIWSSTAILFFWIGIIYFWSSGLTSFTVFSKTLNDAGKLPRELPTLEVTNHNNEVYNLQDFANYRLINFIYLSCPDVCHKVSNSLEDIYHQIETEYDFENLKFISLSFDLANDKLNRIKLYRNYFEGSGSIDHWDFAVPNDLTQEEFDIFLKDIGIWKYTSPQTLITNHSIYLFLISPENKIIKVFDPARDSNSLIAKEILDCITKENS